MTWCKEATKQRWSGILLGTASEETRGHWHRTLKDPAVAVDFDADRQLIRDLAREVPAEILRTGGTGCNGPRFLATNSVAKALAG